MQLLWLMDGIPNINFYYVFTFLNFFLGDFIIVGLMGEAVVIAEDFRPLIPGLFLSPDNMILVLAYLPRDAIEVPKHLSPI